MDIMHALPWWVSLLLVVILIAAPGLLVARYIFRADRTTYGEYKARHRARD